MKLLRIATCLLVCLVVTKATSVDALPQYGYEIVYYSPVYDSSGTSLVGLRETGNEGFTCGGLYFSYGGPETSPGCPTFKRELRYHCFENEWIETWYSGTPDSWGVIPYPATEYCVCWM